MRERVVGSGYRMQPIEGDPWDDEVSQSAGSRERLRGLI